MIARCCGAFGAVLVDKPDPTIHPDEQAIYVACDDGTIFYRPLTQAGWEELKPPVPGTETAGD